MSVLQRIRRATWKLWAGRLIVALLWGGSIAAIAWLFWSFVGRGASAPAVAMIFGVAVAGATLWRVRALRSPLQVALWIEEQIPGQQFALVTTIELELRDQLPPRELRESAESAGIEEAAGRALRRMLVRPLLVAVVAVAAVVMLHERAGGSQDRIAAVTTAAPAASRLTPLVAVVTPPYYARQPMVRLQEPDRISALVGSAVVLHGRGEANGVMAQRGTDTVRATADGNGWALPVTLPTLPGVLRLLDRNHSRVIMLDPRTDSVPEVTLLLPERDTTYQVFPARPVVLSARLRDDIGLARGHWELLITTGSGEEFETVTRNVGRRELAGEGRADLRLSIRLDTFRLTPGSVINLRAIAFDRNDVTGPGRGVSETRTIRLAAVIDSTGVTAEPAIPIDSMWMSQRLLNLRTDTLLLERPRLARTEFTSRSANLSNSQETIRGRVLAVITDLEDDGVGGTAPTEDSRLLRQAADAMQEARFLLAVVDPDGARPHMRRALAILDQIRTAKRYHLRGVIRPTPIDIAKVRMTGTERGAPVPAVARGALPASDREIARRIELGGRLYTTEPAAALDSLTVLQAELLQRRPELAMMLSVAVGKLREGVPGAVALASVRRALASRPVLLGGSTAWTGSGE